MSTINLDEALKALKDQGLTFAQCTKLFGDPNSPYIRGVEVRDGELELDDTPVISESSDGEPCRVVSKYQCDECDQEWEIQWSCECDDECSSCGHGI